MLTGSIPDTWERLQMNPGMCYFVLSFNMPET